MKLPSLSPRERRIIRLAALILVPSLGYIYGVKPYMTSLSAMRDQLVTERSTLVRERVLITDSATNPQKKFSTDAAVQKTAPLLFDGHDNIIASAGLASHVTRIAERSRVNLQQAATRPTIVSDAGVRMLRIEVRGESDLEGILDFLNALETGGKLVRFDKLDISRAPGRSTDEDGYETLTLAATITGFALADAPPANQATPRAAIRPAALANQRGSQ